MAAIFSASLTSPRLPRSTSCVSPSSKRLRYSASFSSALRMNSVRAPRVKLRSFVHRLDARAIHRHELSPKQVKLPAQQHKLPEHLPEGSTVVAAEVSDRLEVRLQMPQQPDHLDVAVALRLQPPARAHPVQVTVDVERQE